MILCVAYIYQDSLLATIRSLILTGSPRTDEIDYGVYFVYEDGYVNNDWSATGSYGRNRISSSPRTDYTNHAHSLNVDGDVYYDHVTWRSCGRSSPDIINLVRGFNVGDDGYIYDYGSNSVDFDSCGMRIFTEAKILFRSPDTNTIINNGIGAWYVTPDGVVGNNYTVGNSYGRKALRTFLMIFVHIMYAMMGILLVMIQQHGIPAGNTLRTSSTTTMRIVRARAVTLATIGVLTMPAGGVSRNFIFHYN